MEDYPRNLRDFEARFATDRAYRDYLFQLRWPEGFRRPKWESIRKCGVAAVDLPAFSTLTSHFALTYRR